jgi:hypothetical protein
MSINFCIQGTRYASHTAGFRLLYVKLDISFIAKAARILMYGRHRRNPSLLQFTAGEGTTEDDLGTKHEIDLILNVDERMRLFFSTRDPGCEIETIRFNLEELAFPWLLGQAEHTICTSRRFFDSYCFQRESWRAYPHTKDVLTQCYVSGCSCQAEGAVEAS